jgi:hypothetical protein
VALNIDPQTSLHARRVRADQCCCYGDLNINIITEHTRIAEVIFKQQTSPVPPTYHSKPFQTSDYYTMLRRPPTAIILTSEDIIRYEEARQQKLAQIAQRVREMSAETAKPAAKSKRTNTASEKAQRSASDRIMGAGNAGSSR